MADIPAYELVDRIGKIADALRDAGHLIDRMPATKRAAFEALFDQQHYLGDLTDVGKTMAAIADEWQGEIDRAGMDA